MVLGWELEGVRAAGPAPSPAALTAPHCTGNLVFPGCFLCSETSPGRTGRGSPRGLGSQGRTSPPSPMRDRAAGAQRTPPLIKALPPPAPLCPLLAPPSLMGCPWGGGGCCFGGGVMEFNVRGGGGGLLGGLHRSRGNGAILSCLHQGRAGAGAAPVRTEMLSEGVWGCGTGHSAGTWSCWGGCGGPMGVPGLEQLRCGAG